MKKNNLLPDADGKLIAVFQNESLQFSDILAIEMVHHHEMHAVSLGIMASTIEESSLSIIKIPVSAPPQMVYPVNRVTQIIVVMGKTNQIVRIFLKVLGKDCHNHPPHLFIRSATTLSVGKPEHTVEDTMVAHLHHLDKMKHIEAIRSIVKLHRRITSSLQHQLGCDVDFRNSFFGNSI